MLASALPGAIQRRPAALPTPPSRAVAPGWAAEGAAKTAGLWAPAPAAGDPGRPARRGLAGAPPAVPDGAGLRHSASEPPAPQAETTTVTPFEGPERARDRRPPFRLGEEVELPEAAAERAAAVTSTLDALPALRPEGPLARPPVLSPELVPPPFVEPEVASVPARRPTGPDPAYDAAAQERALLAMADSLILGHPLPNAAPSRRSAAGGAGPEGEGEPTFHVTIGKLEVVAPPPEVRRPRRTRPAPRLSLQDYLDRRRVGR